MANELGRHDRDSPRYQLSDDEVRFLSAELLSEQPPRTADRFVCYKLDTDSPYANLARTIECSVFDEAFGNKVDDMEKEYSRYEQQSTFFLSMDTQNTQPTGALRIIENGPAGLKSLNDAKDLQLVPSIESVQRFHGIDDLDECWDVGTVAIPREYRSGEGSVSVQLYRGMYVAAMDQGINHFVSIVDTKPLKKLTNYLGIPFVPLADTKPFAYLGSSESQAVYGYVPDFYKKMNAKRRFTIRGKLARKALSRLVQGSEDQTLQFGDRYKK